VSLWARPGSGIRVGLGDRITKTASSRVVETADGETREQRSNFQRLCTVWTVPKASTRTISDLQTVEQRPEMPTNLRSLRHRSHSALHRTGFVWRKRGLFGSLLVIPQWNSSFVHGSFRVFRSDVNAALCRWNLFPQCRNTEGSVREAVGRRTAGPGS
jgi:hypothetical protein